MPDLVGCSDAEWDGILPGFARPPSLRKRKELGSLSAEFGLDFGPLRAYQKAVQKSVAQGIIPGYCSIVVWRDRVLHVDAHGFADGERETPMRTDSVVRLYCMTKSIVSTALMVLVEQGKCDLDDEVSRYIPAFDGVRVAASPDSDTPSHEDRPQQAKLTLRRLLTHCSGLGYGNEFNRAPETPAERSYNRLVQAVETVEVSDLRTFCESLAIWCPLRHQPGSRFEYSYGLDVIGRVIEVVAAKPLDSFLQEAIFQPLGLVDTGFFVRHTELSRLAALYGSLDTARALGQAPTSLPKDHQPKPPWKLFRLDGEKPEDSAWAEGSACSVHSGGGLMGHNRGGLVSTLNDVARFCLMLSCGGQLPGGVRILQEQTVKDMVGHDWLAMPECIGQQQVTQGTPGVTAKGPFGWNGLGEFGVNADKSALSPDAFEAGEYGYGGIAETFWSVNPDRNLVVLWFTQQVDNHSWSSSVANLWLAARRAVAHAAMPPSLPLTSGASVPQASKTRRRIVGKATAEASASSA